MDSVGAWWDGAELWITGLTFPLQAVVVMAVVLPVAAAAAVLLDRASAAVLHRLGRPDEPASDGRP